MAYKQEPCPLCGRDMTAIETYPGRGELYCDYCDLTIGGNDAKTPEELIALMDSSEYRQLKVENTRLQEIVADGEMHAREILAENAKLREFAHGLIDGYECGRGELCDGCTWDGMSDPREFNCKVRAEARELGVTVDD